MITLLKRPRRWKDGTFDLAFVGKASDKKPTDIYERMRIGNGSTFLEMDTVTLFWYDLTTQEWVEGEMEDW